APPTDDGASIERDGRGLPRRVTTPGGRRFTFERDAAGRTTAIDGPGGRLELDRDAHGRRITVRDGAGREAHATRDAQGRVEELAAADGSSIALAYDESGRPTRVGDVELAWDAEGRLATTSTSTPESRVTYTHEAGQERADTAWGAFTRVTGEDGQVSALDTPA